MIIRTFIDKTNTIYKNNSVNTGLSPISELNYGTNVSRTLLYFNIDYLRENYINKNITDLSSVKHILKLTNCGSLEQNFNVTPIGSSCLTKERATSFDILIFKIPQEWDAGVGFDYSDNYVSIVNVLDKNNSGSNWYQSRNTISWPEKGVYSKDTLSSELIKYLNNQDSIVVGTQHFNYGNESFEIDLTNVVNQMIVGSIPNYGFGIAFTPTFEDLQLTSDNYVGYFTNHTNTFFEPYLETIVDNTIIDDRAFFYLNKINRLYLYCEINNNYENLDVLPICTINEQEYEVKQNSKGVYYVEVPCLPTEFAEHAIYYDTWSNIIFNGIQMDDIEMEFVILKPTPFFNIGNGEIKKETFKPNIIGINNNEILSQTDVRLLKVDFRKAWTVDYNSNVTNAEYRLYVKDGNNEIDVINFHPINRRFLDSYFYIDTRTLVPSIYYIDIKTNFNNEIKIFKEIIKFTITDNISAMKK